MNKQRRRDFLNSLRYVLEISNLSNLRQNHETYTRETTGTFYSELLFTAGDSRVIPGLGLIVMTGVVLSLHSIVNCPF